MCRENRSCVEFISRAEISLSVQRAFTETYSVTKDNVWAPCKMYIQSPVPSPAPSTSSSASQSKNDRDWIQFIGASSGSSHDGILLLTVRRKLDGRIDVYLTSLALGLVSCFNLSPAASAASDSQFKPVLLVDEDQGFFVLNHGHPLSPKQGYVIIDADQRAAILRVCGFTAADDLSGVNCPQMLYCTSYMCQRREDSARRGTHARAIAIVSTNRWALALRPLVVEATVSTFSPECARPADILPKLMAAANALPSVPTYSDVERCARRWGPCGGRSMQNVPPGQAVANLESDAEGQITKVLNCSAEWEGRRISLSIPLLLDDYEICAANVTLLLKTFKESVSTIFRFCLLEKRVLFLGRSSPAWMTCKMVSFFLALQG